MLIYSKYIGGGINKGRRYSLMCGRRGAYDVDVVDAASAIEEHASAVDMIA